MQCSECDPEEERDVDVQMEEEEKEERGRELSLYDDTPLAMRIIKSSSGGNHIPGVREEPEGPSYGGSGKGSVCSEGHPGRLSYHPYDLAKSVRDGSSFLCSQECLSLIQSDGSCHYEGDHSGVESDGDKSGFLTDCSVELGSPFHEGGPVVQRAKLNRKLVPLKR